MTCPNCGTENTNDSKLCAKCGKNYDNENNNTANNLTTNTENITPQNKTSNTKISLSTSTTYIFFPISFSPPRLNILILLIFYSFLFVSQS